MYENFYSLKEAPFRDSSDPKYLFLSEKHESTFGNLLNCFQNQDGHALLLGEQGTGKSIYARAVVENLAPNTLSAYFSEPFEHSEQLIMQICKAFETHSTDANAKTGYIMRLRSLMELLSANDQHAVLLIDNAHNLSEDILEEVHLLMEYEPSKGQSLQFCLIGRPELQHILAQPHFEPLDQLLGQRLQLDPFGPEETDAYIKHRLHLAGYEMVGDLFDASAVQAVHSYTDGNPRQINFLCEHALILGSERGLNEIDASLIHEAHAMDSGAGGRELLQDNLQAKEQDDGPPTKPRWSAEPAAAKTRISPDTRYPATQNSHASRNDLAPSLHEAPSVAAQQQHATGSESERFFGHAAEKPSPQPQQARAEAAHPDSRPQEQNVTISSVVLETIIKRTQRRVERYFRQRYLLIKKPEPGMWVPIVIIFLLIYTILFLLTAAVLKKFSFF